MPSPSISNSPSILDLTFSQKFAVGSGHFVNDITASIWFNYYIVYIQEVAGLRPDVGGSLMLLGQVVDAVATPVIGHLADCGWGRSGIFSMGRLKSWHLFGVVLAVLSFPLIFSPPISGSAVMETDTTAKVFYYVPFIIFYEVSWAAVQISHLAIIPKINPDMYVRTEILSIRYNLMVIANVTVFLITWVSMGMSENCKIDGTDGPVFQRLAFIAMAIGVVSAIIFYFSTKEHRDQDVRDAVILWEQREAERPRRSFLDEESTPLLLPHNTNIRRISLSTKHLNPGLDQMTTKDWLRTPQFYLVAFVYIPGRIIMNIPQSFLPLYLQKSLNLPCSTVAIVPLIYFLAGFFVAPWMKGMAKRIGKQLSFGLGITLNLVGSGLVLWGSEWMKNEYAVYLVFAMLGGGGSAGMVTGLSITADLIGTNVESSAFVYGFMSFCDKMTCGIVIMWISCISPSSDASVETIADFYRYVVSWSCFGCSAMATIGLVGITILIFRKNIRRGS